MEFVARPPQRRNACRPIAVGIGAVLRISLRRTQQVAAVWQGNVRPARRLDRRNDGGSRASGRVGIQQRSGCSGSLAFATRSTASRIDCMTRLRGAASMSRMLTSRRRQCGMPLTAPGVTRQTPTVATESDSRSCLRRPRRRGSPRRRRARASRRSGISTVPGVAALTDDVDPRSDAGRGDRLDNTDRQADPAPEPAPARYGARRMRNNGWTAASHSSSGPTKPAWRRISLQVSPLRRRSKRPAIRGSSAPAHRPAPQAADTKPRGLLTREQDQLDGSGPVGIPPASEPGSPRSRRARRPSHRTSLAGIASICEPVAVQPGVRDDFPPSGSNVLPISVLRGPPGQPRRKAV